MNDWKTSPSSLVLQLPLGFTETPPIHPALIPSTLTIPLLVESTYAPDIFQYYCLSPLDCYCHNCLRSGMEEMTGPSGSTLSILRGYDPSNPRIVPFERCDYTHRSTGYTHSLVRSYRRVSSAFPTVRFRRLRSTPTVDA